MLYNTIKKKWAIHYLNIQFFIELFKTDYKKKMVLIQAYNESKFIGTFATL